MTEIPLTKKELIAKARADYDKALTLKLQAIADMDAAEAMPDEVKNDN